MEFDFRLRDVIREDALELDVELMRLAERADRLQKTAQVLAGRSQGSTALLDLIHGFAHEIDDLRAAWERDVYRYVGLSEPVCITTVALLLQGGTWEKHQAITDEDQPFTDSHMTELLERLTRTNRPEILHFLVTDVSRDQRRRFPSLWRAAWHGDDLAVKLQDPDTDVQAFVAEVTGDSAPGTGTPEPE